MLANEGYDEAGDMSRDEEPLDEGRKGGSTTHTGKGEQPNQKGRDEEDDKTSSTY